METKFHSIKIASEVKAKLDSLKKNRSYNEYILLMLNYFQYTNSYPEQWQTFPMQVLKKDIERVVTILKAQEKTIHKINQENILNLYKLIQNKGTGEGKENDENYMHIDDVIELQSTAVSLDQELKQAYIKIKEMEAETEKLTIKIKEKAESSGDIDRENIKDLLKELEKKIHPNGKGEVLMSENFLQLFISEVYKIVEK